MRSECSSGAASTQDGSDFDFAIIQEAQRMLIWCRLYAGMVWAYGVVSGNELHIVSWSRTSVLPQSL